MSKRPPSDEEDGDEDSASLVPSCDDDAPPSTVAKAYIQPEEECPKLLRFIYDCPMICKITEDKKLKKGLNKFWICKWCPTTINGPRKFAGHNATKALSHVCGIAGQNVKECNGAIHPDWLKNYHDLWRGKNTRKEEMVVSKRALSEKIKDTQVSLCCRILISLRF